MRVHHLNCGTHCPLGGALFDGASRGLFGHLPTHCLLIETPSAGLVLVDTGYGLEDVRRPHARLPVLWPLLINPRLREGETARRQIEALGFSAHDVRHILLTHLDFDHAGGLEDFPEARVHVLATEHAAASARCGFVAHQRYRARQWDEVRDWRFYEPSGEGWHGVATPERPRCPNLLKPLREKLPNPRACVFKVMRVLCQTEWADQACAPTIVPLLVTVTVCPFLRIA
jgi:glyoxylase-like metal-dependent hydrolase (beta-lactamase superfamily II)